MKNKNLFIPVVIATLMMLTSRGQADVWADVNPKTARTDEAVCGIPSKITSTGNEMILEMYNYDGKERYMDSSTRLQNFTVKIKNTNDCSSQNLFTAVTKSLSDTMANSLNTDRARDVKTCIHFVKKEGKVVSVTTMNFNDPADGVPEDRSPSERAFGIPKLTSSPKPSSPKPSAAK